ncbi:hypothetical protein EJ06DRAFT_188124 [Trichodelitschia bisporula]|uniref:Arrestin-like N-terminal domain-containing protein n=1 Tax=Trichodelitschia bisporula TaxID=703511 RepID=A0A6G1I738_9PEZI|nr:hypothetical protein EJ06DRAFT_188124 [Trichodelitschia bisporula]
MPGSRQQSRRPPGRLPPTTSLHNAASIRTGAIRGNEQQPTGIAGHRTANCARLDTEMARSPRVAGIASPPPSFARPNALDIRLTTNSNAFFFPRSPVTGDVVYHPPNPNDTGFLEIAFYGVNSVTIQRPAQCDQPSLLFQDRVILFLYRQQLHTGSWRYAEPSGRFKFNLRCPTATENRPFTHYRTVTAASATTPSIPIPSYHHHHHYAQQDVHQTWRNAIHDLPPSFDLSSANMSCSVEYMLEARLYGGSAAGPLLAQCQLPIQFLPFRPSPGAHVLSPSMSSPLRSTSPVTSLLAFPTPRNHVTPLGEFPISPEVNVSLTLHLPTEIITGLKFYIEVRLEAYLPAVTEDKSSPTSGSVSSASTDGPTDPAAILPYCRAKLSSLALLRTTSCRAMLQPGHETESSHQETKPLSAIAERVGSSSGRTSPGYGLGLGLGSERPLTAGSPALVFVFSAVVPSDFSPSFKSFLIASGYALQAGVTATVYGRKIEASGGLQGVVVLPTRENPVPARHGSGFGGV